MQVLTHQLPVIAALLFAPAPVLVLDCNSFTPEQCQTLRHILAALPEQPSEPA